MGPKKLELQWGTGAPDLVRTPTKPPASSRSKPNRFRLQLITGTIHPAYSPLKVQSCFSLGQASVFGLCLSVL